MNEHPPFKPQSKLDCDVLIIGGGVNGCGIARELAGSGVRVCLAEMGDLASGTSSWSSKLVHGGLRYLEQYDFRLVRESLIERQTLLNMAPHLVHPKRFILPHTDQMRPKWMLRAGLFLYDHLGLFSAHGISKKLKGSTFVSLHKRKGENPLKSEFTSAFEYSDCFVDDTRLTILNAVSAAQHGATILTRQKITSLAPSTTGWAAQTACFNITAKAVINATGPWADIVLAENELAGNHRHIRLVQGSHILVPKLYQHDQPYILQHDDKRIIFAIPYLNDFTLLGTTDADFEGDPAKAKISEAEKHYILNIANHYFNKQLSQADIIASFSGVRPLYDNARSEAQKASRDYQLEWHKNYPQFLNIFGGKLTTYRRLSQEAAKMICTNLGFMPSVDWRSDSHLPGGQLGIPFEQWKENIYTQYPAFDRPLLTRLAQAYGTEISSILAQCKTEADLGLNFGHGLTEAEVNYLMDREWAHTPSDILWRRSKLGYIFSLEQKEKLAEYMQQRQSRLS